MSLYALPGFPRNEMLETKLPRMDKPMAQLGKALEPTVNPSVVSLPRRNPAPSASVPTR